MILSIMQPAYLPWAGYFDRLLKSDLHIVLDHVQLERRGFSHRNKLRTAQGNIWLTLPVRKTASRSELTIDAALVNDEVRWRRQHLATLRHNYARAPFFAGYEPVFRTAYAEAGERLVDVIDTFMTILLQALEIETPMLRSSGMGVTSAKSQLILDLCLETGADQYLSGPFGRDYLDRDAFKRAGIEILWHDYDHPVYKQAFPGFEPYMSVVDALFNHGPHTRAIISGEGGTGVKA